jgi:ABC-type cobalamin/Fe3+-siderophores transport system ATPase subunit
VCLFFGKFYMLCITNLDLNIGTKKICTQLTINVPMHSRLAIIGRNGVGKSTLLKYMLKPEAKKILWQHKNNEYIDFSRFNSKSIQTYIAYVAQKTAFHRMMYPKNLYDLVTQRIENEHVDLYTQAFDIPQHCLNELSGGEAQLVEALTCLIQRSHVLLLDEPTTYLDWVNRKVLLDCLVHRSQNYDSVIIAVMHDIDCIAQYFTHVLYLKGNGEYIFKEIKNYTTADIMEMIQESGHYSAIPELLSTPLLAN